MLDLNENILYKEAVLEFDKYYLYFYENSMEFAFEYYILDKQFNEIDGGQFCFGIYNERTEMYDSYDGHPVTYKDFFDYLNDDFIDYKFNENGIEIVSEDIIGIINDQLS